MVFELSCCFFSKHVPKILLQITTHHKYVDASHRKMISDKTSLNMDQMNLITFGMSAVSLVGAVIQLAMISSTTAEDIYRSYLGKVASCHFSLVSSEL